MAIEFKDGKYVDPQTGRVTLDPTVYKDWQIAEEAEKNLPPVDYFREKLGLLPEEIIPYGKTPKIDFIKVMKRLKDKPDGKFIEVTAITPTPFGEGKSTVSLGLIEGLGKLGLNVGGALRQPSGGPTMNVKGTAAGGGNALLMPMTEFSLGLTGDINDIMNAHNLAMTALNARMQHERNYDDETLGKRGLRRLDTSRIYYIESEGHRVHFYTEEGDFAAPGALKTLEEKLADRPFARCNSGYLVNLAQVQAVQQNTVEVGPYELQVSRPKRKSFLAALTDYIGGDGL